MARGNFYENNGTTIMDHIAIDKSTNIIKEVIQLPILHHHLLELD